MKVSAIAYDTQNNKPREMERITWISFDKNGKPQRVNAPNGIQYHDFELHITLEDGTLIKWNEHE